jgi:hypothetical protein
MRGKPRRTSSIRRFRLPQLASREQIRTEDEIRDSVVCAGVTHCKTAIPNHGRKKAGQVVKQPADIGYERRGAARATAVSREEQL